jgi:hypothetical protein
MAFATRAGLHNRSFQSSRDRYRTPCCLSIVAVGNTRSRPSGCTKTCIETVPLEGLLQPILLRIAPRNAARCHPARQLLPVPCCILSPSSCPKTLASPYCCKASIGPSSSTSTTTRFFSCEPGSSNSTHQVGYSYSKRYPNKDENPQGRQYRPGRTTQVLGTTLGTHRVRG